MRHVLIVFPSEADEARLARLPGLAERFDLMRVPGPDVAHPADLIRDGWIEDVAEEFGLRVDGVLTTRGEPATTLAALLALRLTEAGPPPLAVRAASRRDETLARLADALPDHTPRHHLLAAGASAADVPGGYPWQVLPAFVDVERPAPVVADAAALQAVLDDAADRAARADDLRLARALADACASEPPAGLPVVLREPVDAPRASVAGWVHQGEIHVPATAGELGELAVRVVKALDLDHLVFRIEFARPADGPPLVLDVRPHLGGTGASPDEPLEGLDPYEVALAVATGDPPPRT